MGMLKLLMFKNVLEELNILLIYSQLYSKIFLYVMNKKVVNIKNKQWMLLYQANNLLIFYIVLYNGNRQQWWANINSYVYMI